MTDLANTSYVPGAVPGQVVPAPFDPPIVDLGDLLTVRGVIENFGTTNEFFVHHGFYLSADEQIDTSDTLIGETLWDLAFTDAFEFEAIMSVDADLAPGSYYVGSILDDLDEVLELHEDNNAASSCSVLLVRQLSPVIDALPAGDRRRQRALHRTHAHRDPSGQHGPDHLESRCSAAGDGDRPCNGGHHLA